MAEALVAISAFSAIASLVGEFAQLGKRLSYYARHIKHARAEVEELDHEVAEFNFFLGVFHKTADRLESVNLPLFRTVAKADLATILLRHSDLILDGADRLLCKLKPLRDDKPFSVSERFIARWRWASEKDDVQPLKISLISIKTSMQLFFTIILISEKEVEIQARRQDGDDISKLQAELKKLKKELRQVQDRCDRAERTLESQQSHSQPLLPSLSRTVSAITSHELSRQRETRLTRGSDPSNSPTASTFSTNATGTFPRPLNSTTTRSTPIPLSPAVGASRIDPRARGWTRTALFAQEPESEIRLARSRSPQDIVVDDGVSPVHVVHRVPRTGSSDSSDGG